MSSAVSTAERTAAIETASARPLLEVRDLRTHFAVDEGEFRAVDGVSFTLAAGRTLGIVGESGCGKSTLLFAVAQLLAPPARIAAGSVKFEGTNLVGLTDKQLSAVRWRDMSVVMQSAMNALNPVLNVRDQLLDVIHAHMKMPRDEARERAGSLLDLVGIPRSRLRSYPHEFSGGMRHRVMIALALATEPAVIIMD